MSTFELSQQQLRFFETFGFLKFPGLLADRIEQVSDAFEGVWVNRGGGHDGKAHDGRARSCIFPFIDQSEYLSSLLDDPRIEGIAAGLLGDDFNYMGSDGNYYVGSTSWHSDGWNPHIRHIKIAFYLDPVAASSGALRVVPGSHHIGDAYAEAVQKEIWQSETNWAMDGAEVPAVSLDSVPGDIVCFNHNLKHASFGGSASRRMFTMNLCERYAEENLDELRDYFRGYARFWIDRIYGETMVKTAGPQRMRHLEQVMANDGGLAELSRAARESMLEPSRG